ncbi:MAG TPA: hypothetical protein VGZ71_11135 [Puia sp.]|jgi:hypothetical protein|nr:hypothetical protein [Puia sp.]
MRNILPKSMILFFPVAMVVADCNKKSSSQSKMGLLTKAAWRYEKAGFDSNQQGVMDVLDPRITDCQKDDLTIFYPDGTGSFDAGSLPCKPSDPSSLPFFWSFQNNAKTIYFQEQNFTIKTLTDKKLEIYSTQDFGGIKTNYIIVFKH